MEAFVILGDGDFFDLTRFNNIAKQQVPGGKWTRKPLAYRESNNFLIYV